MHPPYGKVSWMKMSLVTQAILEYKATTVTGYGRNGYFIDLLDSLGNTVSTAIDYEFPYGLELIRMDINFNPIWDIQVNLTTDPGGQGCGINPLI